MTLPTTTSVDAWRANTARQLDTVRAALLDLIDHGTTDAIARTREPSGRDLDATHRSPSGHDHRGADLFDPTPQAAGRRPLGQQCDPTGRAVETWERAVQDAVLTLYSTVATVDGIVAALGLTAYDAVGDVLLSPREPDVRHSRTTGRPLVVNHPRLCRLAVLDACTWLASAADALADRMRAVNDVEVAGRLHDHARTFEVLLTRQARVYADDRVTACQAGCRHLAGSDGWCDEHRPRRCQGESCKRVVERRRFCDRCRKRRSRAA